MINLFGRQYFSWIFLLLIKHVISFQVSITSTNNYASAATNHVLFISGSGDPIISGLQIQIQYDPVWDLSSVSGFDLSSDYCETGCTISNVAMTRLTNLITIKNLFPTATSNSYTAQYTIKNIKNPSYQYVQSFMVKLMNGASTYLIAFPEITVNPSQMTCMAMPTNKLVSAITQYSFSITPPSVFPSNGYMSVRFPTKWSNSQQSEVFQSPTCSNPSNTITCPQTSSSTLQLNNLIPSSSSSPFTFTLNNIRNPGSTGINQQLILIYYTLGSSAISKCNVQISGLLPTTLTGVSFNPNCKTNQLTTGVIYLTIVEKPMITDSMSITFQPKINVFSLVKVFIFAGTDITPLNKEIVIQSSTSTSSVISFNPFGTNNINNFRIQLYSLICPSTTKLTSQIKIQIFRYGYVISTYQCCQFQSTISNFVAASVSTQNNMMALTTNYNFQITISQGLGSGSNYIDIYFPSIYALTISSPFSCYIQGLSTPSSTTCVVTSANCLSVSISGKNLSMILETKTISSQVTMNIILFGILNPSITSASFDIYLTDSTHQNLQGITGITTTFKTTIISSVNIAISSLQIYTQALYSFKVNNTNVLEASSILRIVFPKQITLVSLNCMLNSVSTSCTSSTVGSGNTQVLVTLASFKILQYALSGVNISVGSFINPPSLQPSESFIFQLQSLGVPLQGIYSTKPVTMTTASTFNTLNPSIQNNTVYQKSQYSFTYNLGIPYDNTKIYVIKVSFPIDFTVITCTLCTEYSYFTLGASNGVITFDQIKNPSKTIISSTIGFQLLINGYTSLIKNILISTFVPIVQGFTVIYNHNLLGIPVNLLVNATNIQNQMQIWKLQIPSQFTIGVLNVSCLSCKLVTFSLASNIVTITLNKIASSLVSLQITGLTSPLTFPSSSFSLSTYDLTSNVLISQSSLLSNFFTIICQPECLTCSLGDTSKCLSCYNNTLVNSLKFYDTVAFTCRAACLTTHFQAGYTCYPCDPNCATCINDSKICNSCSGSNFLYTNKCVTSCPTTLYPNNFLCNACQPPCLTCNSLNNCLYCVAGKLLRSDGSCQATCLSGTYNKSNICTSCPSNCALCDPFGCSSCLATFYLIANKCVSQCPYSYYPDLTLTLCQLCKSPCLSCSSTSRTCTSCSSLSTNSYLHLNQCVPVCPPQFYPNHQLFCESCIPPCLSCVSSTNCSSCVNGYFLYAVARQCFANCPQNTIKIGLQCVECQSPCLQCVGTVTTCSSCKQSYFLDQLMFTCNITCLTPYVGLNRKCQKCVTPCLTCATGLPYNCLTCINGYNFLQNTCYSPCPSTTYSVSGQCLSCTSGCYECISTSSTCTSCYPGTYLFFSACIPNCPLVPVYYYEYQSQCITCQSPCNNCLASPVQCADCLNTLDYWNSVTLTCTGTCQNPYFAVVINSQKQCKQCSLPCKTCSTNYNKCASCYNGKYLISQNCYNSCPLKYYSLSNQCISCPSLCLNCNQFLCISCLAPNLLYKGQCYSKCPTQAPYSYQNYCRNCLKDNCLLCNKKNQCIMCFQGYFMFQGACIHTCPSQYEPDTLTNISCVKKAEQALFQYLTEEQKRKIFVFPASIITILIILSTFVVKNPSKINSLFSLIGIPQYIATIIFVYFYQLYAQVDLRFIPSFSLNGGILIALASLMVIISVIFTYKFFKKMALDSEFNKCYQMGSNQKRTNLIILLSIFNFKLSKLLFSGFLEIPLTSYQLRNKQSLRYLNWMIVLSLFIFTAPFIMICLYVIIPQKAYLTNSKLFYSAIDLLIVETISFITSCIYLRKQQNIPLPYKKYIIEGISNLSLPPLSEHIQEIENEQDDNPHLFHSNSIDEIKQNQQMKAVDFKSVFDPTDFQDPPILPTKQLQNALKKGKFRTKLKPKKKGKGKYKLDDLDIISEENSDQDQNKLFNIKKRRKNGNVTNGGMNNFIYWKPPKQKKNQAQRAFKQNKRQIMQKIYEKQSEFDTITNNDIIFLQDSQKHNSSISSNEQNIQEISHEESKRQLNANLKSKNQYNDLFNLNYAKRKHLN